jgi:hypothetical protein
VIYAEKLLAKISKSVIYKDNFRPVTVKVGKSDWEKLNQAVVVVVVDDVKLISGIHIASRMFVNFLWH